METFHFSNSDIDLACERGGEFLAKSSVERREALRIKLTFEEVLLKYQAKFGDETTYKLKCTRRFTAMNIMGWQLTMIDVADSLGSLDKETLRKKI